MSTNSNLIVLVKYQAQPGKEKEALDALNALISKVKTEPHYVNISVLVNPENRSHILLLEEWSNENYYKGEHMRTEHLQGFIKGSGAFLSGPPEITFWKSPSEHA